MLKIKSLVLIALSILFGLTSCEKEEPSTALEEFRESIIGNWQSQSSEYDSVGQNYGFRTLRITDSNWSIVIVRFGDEARTIPLFKLELEGLYYITEISDVLTGSYHGTFGYSKKVITSFIDPSLLGLSDCNMVINEKKDFSTLDCSWLVSIESCPSDFDLISFESGILTPGKRTENMCTEYGRPIEKGFSMSRI